MKPQSAAICQSVCTSAAPAPGPSLQLAAEEFYAVEAKPIGSLSRLSKARCMKTCPQCVTQSKIIKRVTNT